MKGSTFQTNVNRGRQYIINQYKSRPTLSLPNYAHVHFGNIRGGV